MSRRGPLVWTRLDLPTPITVDAARAAVASLAALPGQPRLVLEARGAGGEVGWQIGAESATARRALAAMSHHLPGLRGRVLTGRGRSASVAAVVRLPGHRRAALEVTATESVARSVLGALSGARADEVVRLQVVLGPRHRPRQVGEVAASERARLATKYGEHRFSCELRIGATARDPARAKRLVSATAASLRGLEVPGLALHVKRSSLRTIDEARDPLFWPLELGVSEVVSILGWPIAAKPETVLPGVPSPHPRLLPVDPRIPDRGRLLGVSTLERSRSVAQGVEEAKRVTHVMGPMGVGKSVLITRLALADAAAGRAVVLIDGKGDTLTDFASRLDPSRHDDVVWIDPTDEVPVGIDAFRGEPERQADVLYGVFRSLYGDALGPRSSDLLHAGLLTLARAGDCSLSMLPLLFTSPRSRRSIIGKVSTADPLGLGAVWAWFEAISDAERTQVVAPIRNKLDPLLSLRPGLRAMFGQSTPRFAFSDLFTEPSKRPILLVNLGSAELGPEGARLLGSVLLALIWQAAQSRTRLTASARHPVMLYIDEFQDVVRLGDLSDVMSRARGLGLAFTVAHQSLSQVPPSVKAALLSLTRSRICFQLATADAKEIAATTGGVLTARDFQELPAFTAYASLLVGGDRMPWCSLATEPLPRASYDAAAIRAGSRVRYGRPVAEVEAELYRVAGYSTDPTAESTFGRTRRASGRDGSVT